MTVAFNDLKRQLIQRQEQHLYRIRRCSKGPQQPNMIIDGRTLLSFCSNDYLGLANDEQIKNAAIKAIGEFGVGSGASHLVNGHSIYHDQLEQALALWTNRPRALLFSTGYMANIGVINALAGVNGIVLQDQLNHASLLDGGWLSQAQFKRFPHGNTELVEQWLATQYQQCQPKLVVTDGVFSMDGDLALIKQLAKVCGSNNAWLMVDDAHGVGVLGKNGGGLVEHLNLSDDDVPILVGTLSKAFGCFGAFVAGSETLIESLIQFARTYIYTTALPPSIAASALKALDIIINEPSRRNHLHDLISYFKKEAELINLPLLPSITPIQPLLIGSPDQALKISRMLEEKGILVTAIRPPTVPIDTARLRITLTAKHTTQDIDQLLSALATVDW